MATPRYRVTDEKGAYLPLDPNPQLLQLGADHNAAAVYGIRAPIYTLLRKGAEIDFDGVPGPHLEPLNDEARAKTDKYWAENPGATLDPTRRMPLGQDPMGGKSIEQLVTGLLNAMDKGPAASQQSGPDLVALLAGQAAMQDALASLAVSMATMAAHVAHPVQTGRAR
jgi:hypothetical protein